MEIKSQIELADKFMAEPKLLSGDPPEFGPMKDGRHGLTRTANWPVSSLDGVVRTGRLQVKYAPSQKAFIIALIFRDECVTRIDFVEMAICHSNPLWSARLGLPSDVCGPHFHQWELNRGNILHQETWSLEARVPLQPQIRRFDQAFAWMADQINLNLTAEQRVFNIPQELV